MYRMLRVRRFHCLNILKVVSREVNDQHDCVLKIYILRVFLRLHLEYYQNVPRLMGLDQLWLIHRLQ